MEETQFATSIYQHRDGVLRPEFLQSGDEKYVRDIHRICHPHEPARAPGWYFVHPTLVSQDITKNMMIVGFTSFCMADVNGAPTIFGKDVCVLPEYQGRGIAKTLHAARLTIAQRMGAKIFIGSTKDPAMARILIKGGAHKCLPLGMGNYLFMGILEEV